MQRYFLTKQTPQQSQLTLPRDIAHHLMTVLRAEVGTQVEVVLNNHHVYLAEVSQVEPASIKIVKDLHQNSELPVNVTIACGIPKTANKLDLIVQKSTELGVKRIVFFEASRSISHWNAKKQAKKISRLQKIANSASEQSHRNYQPTVEYGGTLKQLLAEHQETQKLVAWEESAKEGEKSQLAKTVEALQRGDSLLAIFGPEGGITSQEIDLMKEADVVPVGLGPRILRTETAPLYFLAAVSTLTELVR